MEDEELLESLFQDALGESMKWFPHEVNSLQDDCLWSFFEDRGHGDTLKYWLLVEALHEKKGNHSFKVGDMRIAKAMFTDQKDAEEVVKAMLDHGLLDASLYREGIVSIRRVQKQVEDCARSTARKKLGAIKTNRKRAER